MHLLLCFWSKCHSKTWKYCFVYKLLGCFLTLLSLPMHPLLSIQATRFTTPTLPLLLFKNISSHCLLSILLLHHLHKRQLQAQLCHLDSFVITFVIAICHYHLSFLLSLPFVITICHFSLPFSFHFSFCICIKYFNHLSARLACQ